MTVAISGLGIVSPFGIGAPCFFRASMEGRSPTRFDMETVRQELRGRRLRTLNEETMMVLLAVRHALVDGGMTPRLEPSGLGVAVSTRHAGLQEYATLYWRGSHNGRPVNPTLGPQTGFNAPAAQVSIDLGAEGPNATFPGGPVAGLEALSWAVDAIEGKAATTMLACGVDVPSAKLAGKVESRRKGPQPFDYRRFGPIPTAAAVGILLEDERSLLQRGRSPYATVEAVATAFSPLDDLIDAGSRAVERTIEQTQWDFDEIGGCVAGANGSVSGDACEAFALHDTLGRGTPVAAIKGSSGEADGAGALLQVATAVLSLRRGVLPPTTGLVRLDPALPPLTVSSRPIPIDVDRPLIVHTFDPKDAAGAAMVRAGERVD